MRRQSCGDACPRAYASTTCPRGSSSTGSRAIRQDRVEAVRPLIEARGGKVVAAGYPFGEYDALVVFEAPDDTAAASFALVVAGSGAMKAGKTTRLLSGEEWVESLRQAQGAAYRPPQ